MLESHCRKHYLITVIAAQRETHYAVLDYERPEILLKFKDSFTLARFPFLQTGKAVMLILAALNSGTEESPPILVGRTAVARTLKILQNLDCPRLAVHPNEMHRVRAASGIGAPQKRVRGKAHAYRTPILAELAYQFPTVAIVSTPIQPVL